MYYNFDKLNRVLKDLNESPQSQYLSDFISLRGRLKPMLAAVPNNYARSYGQVQLIKYDSDGNPTDITPTDELTVPDSVIASAKAEQLDIITRLNRIKEKIDELSPASKINITKSSDQILLPISVQVRYYGSGGGNRTYWYDPTQQVKPMLWFRSGEVTYSLFLLPGGHTLYSAVDMWQGKVYQVYQQVDNNDCNVFQTNASNVNGANAWGLTSVPATKAFRYNVPNDELLRIDPSYMVRRGVQSNTSAEDDNYVWDADSEDESSMRLPGLIKSNNLVTPTDFVTEESSFDFEIKTSDVLTDLGMEVIDPDW